MTFAREVLDSKQFQSVVDSLKELIDEEGALSVEEWRGEDTRVLYELGYNLYKAKDYENAETIFRKLVIMLPLEKNHWQGLASSIQMQNRNQDALVTWSMYAFIDPKSPLPHFHAAECLLALNDSKDCIKALNALEERDASQDYLEAASVMRKECLNKLEQEDGTS